MHLTPEVLHIVVLLFKKKKKRKHLNKFKKSTLYYNTRE